MTTADVATVRVRLTVAYDGSGFHGFAPNDGVATVGGTLADALSRVLRSPIELTCAGRTDTGVHGWGQVVSFDAPADRLGDDAALLDLRHAVNHICRSAIVVRDAAIARPDFDARFSARARVYRYTVLNRPVPDPFLARTSWHVERPLDLSLLRLACDPLIGEHDFSSFCRAKRVKPRDRVEGAAAASLTRRVVRARWDALDDQVLRFEIEANAFCHQMVRSIVGSLVEVGLGRRTPAQMTAILAARDRHVAGQLAPPHGLCLWLVRY
ncbi:MAG: tRNA pseudouridine(38-40) synthase TruA [Acidimicrobiales bacterium]